jgi:BirA family transcriptional regulator, biotin operon repressor / biotin---[acetyl-CoA-carboxylase] ligase
VSYLFTVSASPAVAAQVGFVAALAIRDLAIELLGDALRDEIKLKWPNDVLLAGAKFSGILAETASPASPTGLRIILGCGINLGFAPDNTPYPVTALARHGASIIVENALSRFSFCLQRWLDVWRAGEGFDHIRTTWLSHAMGRDERFIADQNVEGRFTGLAPDGALILTLPNGTTRNVHSGEVRQMTGSA